MVRYNLAIARKSRNEPFFIFLFFGGNKLLYELHTYGSEVYANYESV